MGRCNMFVRRKARMFLKCTSIGLALTLTFCVFSAHLQAASEGEGKDLMAPPSLEEARKEAKVVWYGSLALNSVTEFLKYFKKKYPYITVEYVRIGSTAVPLKIKNEYRAGLHIPDVIGTSAFPHYLMIKDGVLGKYLSPERKAIPEGFKDKEGYWNAWLLTLYTISYNTKMVSPAEAPRSYEDLLNPRWKGKGKIAMNRDDVKWFIAMLQLMGEEKGLAYMRALLQQGLTIYGIGHSQMANLLAAKEFAVGVCIFPDQVEELKGKGAPMEWVRTSPILVLPSLISITRYPPHPNAAKLFIDYVLSDEGQRSVQASGLRREAIIPRTTQKASAESIKVLEKLNLFPLNPALAEKYDYYEKMWKTVFFSR
jgi:iron(III) transport system substrate-binding protein